METERLQHSLSAQISYYNDKIQKNPDWLFAGVYVDDGISGTGTAKREDFNRMIADADSGKIDIILTKSISRFARNTVDLLETVRHILAFQCLLYSAFRVINYSDKAVVGGMNSEPGSNDSEGSTCGTETDATGISG